jgi:chemotaxis protein histidine kinase CheA
MTVNALWFWFAVELLLIAAGLALYLAHRWRRLARQTEAERRAWDEQRAAARAVVEDAVGAARAAGEAQRQEFLLRLLACLEKREPYGLAQLRALLASFPHVRAAPAGEGEAAPAQAEAARASEPERVDPPAAAVPAAAAGVPGHEEVFAFQEMIDLVDVQRQKIVELMEHKQALVDLRKRFAEMRSDYQAALKRVDAGPGARTEEVVQLRSIVEQLQVHGERMVLKLERENMRLETLLAEMQEENERSRKVHETQRSRIEFLLGERATLVERLAAVEAALEKRTRALERLQSKFTALNREYMHLYESAKMAGQI